MQNLAQIFEYILNVDQKKNICRAISKIYFVQKCKYTVILL